MVDDNLLENDSVQMTAMFLTAIAGVHVAAVGLLDINVLIDTVGLAGETLNAAYGVFGAAGAVRGWDLLGERMD